MKRAAVDIFWRGIRRNRQLSRVILRVARGCAELYGNRITVSVTVVDNEEIRRLNSEYRDLDKATDVLSFPTMEFASPLKPRMEEYDPSRKAVALGDIVISLEKAKEQAGLFGGTLEREMGFLTAHGMLHLMGFDHERSQAEEDRMFTLQEEILNRLGYGKRPY